MERLLEKHTKLLSALNPSFTNSLYRQIPWSDRLVGITGARGVGKTTLMLQYIKENYKKSRDALYVSLDDVAFHYSSLIELADEFAKNGGKHLFIDEIHKYPQWSQELKNIYDLQPDIKVFFTGSSILDIYKGKADLSRRALVFDMHGLSFREYLQIETGQIFSAYSLEDILANHYDIAVSIYERIKPFKYFSDYLQFGYYPYFIENREYYHMKLLNSINQILENDLPYILNIDLQYIPKIKGFLKILANDIPVKPNVAALASVMGVSWKTVVNYMSYLYQAKLIEIIYHSGKSISTLSKPEKVYLHHPNLLYLFKSEPSSKGCVRETFFVNQLSYKHTIEIPPKGDFLIDAKYLFEVGGKNKTYHQISNIPNSFIAADDIEFGTGNKIPLWLFGFLY